MTLTRSQNMARIKAKNTKPELLLRSALWKHGLRYRLHYSVVDVRPDIIFVGKKIAVFVDGCQWHGCPEHYVYPRTRREFWGNKLKKNVERDIAQTMNLRKVGWIPLRFWEHEIWSDLSGTVNIITNLLSTGIDLHNEDWRLIEVQVVDPQLDTEQRRLVMLESPTTEKVVESKRSTRKWNRSKSENVP